MKIELECQECKKMFETDFKHRDKKFCDRTCYFNNAKKNKTIGKQKDPLVRENRTCLVCNKVFNERIKHSKKICSDECRKVWNAMDENINNRIGKSKKSMIEKYGVDSIFKTPEFKQNKKELFLEKYGVEWPMHKKEFVDKLKNTFRVKQLQNLLPRLNQHKIELLDDYTVNKNKNTSLPYNFKCLDCGSIFTSTLLGSGKIPVCRNCNPIEKNSSLELMLRDFLNENNIRHIDNCRKLLGGSEIDIYLPEHNIGIEINGHYYHSELNGCKDKYYHINKTKTASERGVRVIHIFEDEILQKRELVFSRILNLVNLNKSIYARKCVVKEITKKESTKFISENHIQGDTVDKYRYGLFHENELVGAMTFGVKRKALGNNKTEENEYELIRFCSKQGLNIVGGFSKLLKFFIKKNKVAKIITFADVRWSGIIPENTVYSKNGFKFIKLTPPNYWYLNTKHFSIRNHRFTYRKDVLVKEGYDRNKTEWEIMQLKKFDRIWDCGSLKFELEIKNGGQ